MKQTHISRIYDHVCTLVGQHSTCDIWWLTAKRTMPEFRKISCADLEECPRRGLVQSQAPLNPTLVPATNKGR